MDRVIEKRLVTGQGVVELDITPTRVRFESNGYETVMKRAVAQAMEQRGQVKILGDGKAEPRPAGKKAERDEAKLDELNKQLKAEQGKSSPNPNTIRALENQIAKLEG